MSTAVAQSVVPVDITVNGVEHHAEVEPRQLLVHFLRETLGLTGTHVGCDTSSCGACTVHIDGQAVESNLCRCTGYQNIVKAIQYAAKKG